MFIQVNGTYYNTYSITSFNGITDVRQNSDGTDAVIYCIAYSVQGGTSLKEEFNNKEERDEKLDWLIEKLLCSQE